MYSAAGRFFENCWSGARRGLDGAGYLLFPSDCVACSAPDFVLCPPCQAAVRRSCTQPFNATNGADYLISAGGTTLLSVYAAGTYRGELSAAILAFKNHGAISLAALLAHGLAQAVSYAVDHLGRDRTRAPAVLLVPIPASGSGFGRRGYDPLQILLRHRRFRDAVHRAHPSSAVFPLLRAAWRPPWRVLTRASTAQKSLGKAQRGANVSGSFRIRRRALRLLRERWPRAEVILIDDVLTTGATLREAQRELASHAVLVGTAVVLAAVPAANGGATRRKLVNVL